MISLGAQAGSITVNRYAKTSVINKFRQVGLPQDEADEYVNDFMGHRGRKSIIQWFKREHAYLAMAGSQIMT